MQMTCLPHRKNQFCSLSKGAANSHKTDVGAFVGETLQMETILEPRKHISLKQFSVRTDCI